MRDKLRKCYQVQKEVARNGYFEGEIALSEMKRLAGFLQAEKSSQPNRKVVLNFEFAGDEYDAPMIVGHLETNLILECQRCLKALEMPMKLDFKLLIDANDELISDSSVDTLYSDNGYIDIVEVVEDELILAIPLVATHEDTACNENWRVSEPRSGAADTENPFAVLQQLKTTN